MPDAHPSARGHALTSALAVCGAAVGAGLAIRTVLRSAESVIDKLSTLSTTTVRDVSATVSTATADAIANAVTRSISEVIAGLNGTFRPAGIVLQSSPASQYLADQYYAGTDPTDATPEQLVGVDPTDGDSLYVDPDRPTAAGLRPGEPILPHLPRPDDYHWTPSLVPTPPPDLAGENL